MTVAYVDSSALAAAYFPDEAHHEELRGLVFAGAVMTSAITRVELSSAIRMATDANRLREPASLWRTIDSDLGSGGPVAVIQLRSEPILGIATTIVREHRVRTLDAIHLAVALEDGVRAAAPDELTFVTLDHRQAEAATRLGLTLLVFRG